MLTPIIRRALAITVGPLERTARVAIGALTYERANTPFGSCGG